MAGLDENVPSIHQIAARETLLQAIRMEELFCYTY